MQTDFISADGHFNEPKDFYKDIGSVNAPNLFEVDKKFYWGVNNKAIRPNEEVALLLDNKLLFGSDFPHAESTYPNSGVCYEKYLSAFGIKLANKFFYSNALKFYFDEEQKVI